MNQGCNWSDWGTGSTDLRLQRISHSSHMCSLAAALLIPALKCTYTEKLPPACDGNFKVIFGDLNIFPEVAAAVLGNTGNLWIPGQELLLQSSDTRLKERCAQSIQPRDFLQYQGGGPNNAACRLEVFFFFQKALVLPGRLHSCGRPSFSNVVL